MKTKIGVFAALAVRRAIDIELLDVARTVGFALRRAQPLARGGAQRGETLQNLALERRIDRLIIGGVELDLVVIEKDARALLVRWRADAALFGEGWRGGHGRSRG